MSKYNQVGGAKSGGLYFLMNTETVPVEKSINYTEKRIICMTLFEPGFFVAQNLMYNLGRSSVIWADPGNAFVKISFEKYLEKTNDTHSMDERHPNPDKASERVLSPEDWELVYKNSYKNKASIFNSSLIQSKFNNSEIYKEKRGGEFDTHSGFDNFTSFEFMLVHWGVRKLLAYLIDKFTYLECSFIIVAATPEPSSEVFFRYDVTNLLTRYRENNVLKVIGKLSNGEDKIIPLQTKYLKYKNKYLQLKKLIANQQ